ncbi:hypothetical protein GCM10007424_25520 [Flavobacterium suaedae]|uniref:HTH araC/xylS-type domain-containing protein n=1 Tax=Flavobacterium suaedae TaxID=1767027 RepID=A0ABQ1K0L6_9FLAO|nr:helix-turn-helix transcriptional regulator [Flavobacterium suaedae]GGB84384.1 hypothetical protein GCM10007424_25520 [Flavobacterium suaedae]
MNDNDNGMNPVQLPQHNKPLLIEPLDYTNPYNYHKPHRHDYFEVILVKNGEGRQYIDFQEYKMSGGQLYAIYPGQIHLMQRNSANGLLIQFRKDVFKYLQPLKHYQLYFPEQVFNLDDENFNHLYEVAERMMRLLENKELTTFAHHKLYSYLQIILISLPELHDAKSTMLTTNLATEFLSLLPQHITTLKKVSDYCSLMSCSTDKLNEACKTALGKTPLKLIHEELMLEIRRLMLLDKLSLKEIAFELNFDSQANFSNFIKTQSGLTPSGLQAATLQIYK